MSPITHAAVGLVGVVAQTVSTLLLAGLLLLLRRRAAHRRYLRWWTAHWAWLALALVAVGTHYTILPVAAPGADGRPWSARLADGTYQVAKHVALGCLVVGAAFLADARVAPRLARWLPAAAAAAAGLTLVGHEVPFAMVVLRQAPAAVAAYLAVAWLLLRIPDARRGLGTRGMATVALVHAAAWAAYAPGHLWALRGGVVPELPLARVAAMVTAHQTFIDLLLDVLLAFGMVIALTDELWRTAERRAAEAAAAHAALQESALRDPLTGVPNRRAFDEGLGLAPVRAAGRGAVVVLDLDNLKQVNDAHGHAAGDALLRHAARALRDALGDGAALYRWGGDEFLVIAPEEGADAAAARLADAVHRGGDVAGPWPTGAVRVRASVGGASFAGGDDPRVAVLAALAAADEAMYRDKARRKTGRGQAAVPA